MRETLRIIYTARQESIYGLSTWQLRQGGHFVVQTLSQTPSPCWGAIWAKCSVHKWQIGWMSQNPPHTHTTERLQRPVGPNIVYTYGSNLVRCGNKRQRLVDFAPQLPEHCFLFVHLTHTAAWWGQFGNTGIFKNGNSAYSIKNMHCRRVLAFLSQQKSG